MWSKEATSLHGEPPRRALGQAWARAGEGLCRSKGLSEVGVSWPTSPPCALSFFSQFWVPQARFLLLSARGRVGSAPPPETGRDVPPEPGGWAARLGQGPEVCGFPKSRCKLL